MVETLAGLRQNGRIALTTETSSIIDAVEPINPLDVGFLDWPLLASAVALSTPYSLKGGQIIGDRHMHIIKWAL